MTLGVALSTYSGSSPRAWGTDYRHPDPDQQDRFIPTGVGNGDPSRSHTSGRPVHPHGRGERLPIASTSPPWAGSSPRAWGTARPSQNRSTVRRFIPTGVGNGDVMLAVVFALTVHPHGRGERTSSNPLLELDKKTASGGHQPMTSRNKSKTSRQSTNCILSKSGLMVPPNWGQADASDGGSGG